LSYARKHSEPRALARGHFSAPVSPGLRPVL